MMPVPQKICRYLYITTFSVLLVLISSAVYAQADTSSADTATDHKVKKKDLAGHQLCIGTDIFHPILNGFLKDRYSYELEVSYYMHNEYYLVAEGGWGADYVNYSDLEYNSKNDFFRFGFNKCVLTRDTPHDWDMMFMGMRVAAGEIRRGAAAYTVTDTVWGNVKGQTPPATYAAVWAELTGGIRVEIVKGIMMGWNIRGKFMLNGKSFTDPSPLYIAGYGEGDKNAVFDFNMYVSYAIRWKRKSLGLIDPKTGLPVIAKPLAPAVAPAETKEKSAAPDTNKQDTNK